MTPNDHQVNLGKLSRGQLKQLCDDASAELGARENDDRIALEKRLRGVVEEAGFSADDLVLRNGKKTKRKSRTPQVQE